MATEINRLTEMKAVARKPLQELQRVEERETEDGETSTQGTKWLTTKFVFDWRFRNSRWTRRARLDAREFRGQEVRNDTFSPATSASLVRLIPVLGLQQKHSLYSVDVKDAFLQVPQHTPCACHFPKEYLDLFGSAGSYITVGAKDCCCPEYFQDSVMQHFCGVIILQEHSRSRTLTGASHAQLYFEMTGIAFL